MNKTILTTVMAAVVATGCATKDYVHEHVEGQLAPVNKRIDGVDQRVMAGEGRLTALERRAILNESDIGRLTRQSDANEETLRTHTERLVAGEGRLTALEQRVILYEADIGRLTRLANASEEAVVSQYGGGNTISSTPNEPMDRPVSTDKLEKVKPAESKQMDSKSMYEDAKADDTAAVDRLAPQASANDEILRKQNERIDTFSRTAFEALKRAVTAKKLAEGKFMYEMVMADNSLVFTLGESELTKEAKARLDAFADNLKAENRDVYIEIQGHTDSNGSAAYNLKLGDVRAEMVRRYLNIECGIHLHRMATISYGESTPVADNDTPAGREQNRRVVLVVLN